MSYRVDLSKEASKVLGRVDLHLRNRIQKRLRELAEDPYDQRLSSQLMEPPELRKSRVGGWRIVYRVDPSLRIVTVAAIVTRGHVYRN